MKRVTLFAILLSLLTIRANCPNPPPFPKPVLQYLGKTTDSGWNRYHFGVANYTQYTNALFAASPALPPCGLNTSASRTWLYIYDFDTGQYLYGYCALQSSAGMQKLSFSVKATAPQPKKFRIRLHDRLCDVKVFSTNGITIN